jgi:hypothetical protein
MELMACSIVSDIMYLSGLEISATFSLFLGAFLGSMISELDQRVVYKENDPRDQILLKNSNCSKLLQIEREHRHHRYESNVTHLGSNGCRE